MSIVDVYDEYTEVTWIFGAGPYYSGQMILKLSDAITSDGLALDGDWTSPENFDDSIANSTFDGGRWSGDGTTGGDFVFSFTLPNTRPGDANRDGVVDGDDSDIQTANWLQTGKSWSEGDFNGDEFVDDVDATMMAANWLTTVWSSGAITPSDPVACDLVFTVDVDGTLNGQLLGYPQGRAADVTYQLDGGPSQGSLAGGGVNADGTFTYTPPALYSGVTTFTYTVSDGVNSSNVATVTIYVGVAPPRVTCVTLKNSSTGQQRVVPTSAHDSTQLLPVPFFDSSTPVLFDGFDQVIITFDQPVSAAAADMTLNKSGTTYYATGISTNGNTCTWTFDGPDANDMFKYGPLVIDLSDDVVSAYGMNLDGEWTSPEYYGDDEANSTFDGGRKSGDGYEGGDFVFNFSMLLPGDANLDGSVNETDSGIVTENWLDGPGMTWAEGDFNGDGYVNGADATIMGTNWGKTLWATVAFDAEFDVAASGTLNDNLSGEDHLQGDDITFQRILNAEHGSATVNSDGSFTYTPTPGYSGLDTFTFRTFDGVDYSEPATTTVYVGAPTVTDVFVMNSSTYSGTAIETAADGDDQLMPVPIYEGIDQIVIVFDKAVTVAQSDLTLTADGVTVYGADADSFTVGSTYALWIFSTDGPFQFGPMTIELSDAVNANGIALDGEWTSPAYYGDNTGNSTFDGGLTSGDGQHGGDFVFNFSMLFPGDADCDGVVDIIDLGRVAGNYGSGPGMTWAEGDFNFDGYVDSTDYSIMLTNYGLTVWPEPQMLCMGGGILGGEMLLAADTRSSSLESSLSASSALDDLFEKYDFGTSAAAVTAADDFIDEFVTLFEKYEDELALFEDDYVSPHKVSNDLFDSIFAQQELLEA